MKIDRMLGNIKRSAVGLSDIHLKNGRVVSDGREGQFCDVLRLKR